MEMLSGFASLLSLCFIILLFAGGITSSNPEKLNVKKNEPYHYIFHSHVFEEKEHDKNFPS
ncbi:hypothetical protein [Halalkalibacter okhensis]|uniref:Uncharacterized protein n=1 Tax=Halalkalibacter okhensis TaxID=333138 RepID=A0A0B0IEZ1_9BACI|nr:hypothetical protein [Halalkalibacter okhensis]KHF38644.1 hypothetical protein LQ50_19815 [Halalkalibacter okhensis]